jgi:hypothetical protein
VRFPLPQWMRWAGKASDNSFAGGEREEILRSKNNDAQDGGPAGDQSFSDRGVAPKHKVPEEIAPRVGFFSLAPRRVFDTGVSPMQTILAGGEDYGYFA